MKKLKLTRGFLFISIVLNVSLWIHPRIEYQYLDSKDAELRRQSINAISSEIKRYGDLAKKSAECELKK